MSTRTCTRTCTHRRPGSKISRRVKAETLTQHNYGGVIGNYFQALTKRSNFAKIQERKNEARG